LIPDDYFDRFSTAKYRNKNPVQRALIRRFVSKLHSLFIAAGPLASVFEVGCGEGFLSGYLSEKFPQVSFSGVDLDADDVAKAKGLFERFDAQQGSVYDLGSIERAFDLVMCCEVMEHLDEPMRALDQMLSLSPKRVILTVPHEPWFRLSNFLRGKNLTRLGNDIEHVNHWGVRSFRRLISTRVEVEQITTSYPWVLALGRPR